MRLPLILSILFFVILTLPLERDRCCCGCTSNTCPEVGDDCDIPTAPCPEDHANLGIRECDDLKPLITDQIDLELTPMVEVVTANKNETAEDSSDDADYDVETRTFMPRPITVHQKKSLKKKIWKSKNVTLADLESLMSELRGMISVMKETMNLERSVEPEMKEFDIFEIDASVENPVKVGGTFRSSRAKRQDGMENCNDVKLRDIIKKNIKKDVKTSKREIQKASIKEFGGHFNVVCSPCEFSFVVASQKYCDGFKDDIACFAFLQPPTNAKISSE